MDLSHPVLPRPDLALVPRPSTLSARPGRFRLDDTTRLRVTPGTEAAADLLRSCLGPATGLCPEHAEDGTFVLALDPALTGLAEEGYGLTVSAHQVLLRAAHPTGLLRGVQTIRQLLPYEALSAPSEGVELPGVEITDVPAHPWRGMLLDVARHFQPVSYLRRFVDLLALHKLNVLQLHLTDDQGWRMPVTAYPRLTEIGSRRTQSMIGPAGSTRFDGRPHGGSYTRAELTGLVAYAAARGVTVVPEVGVPGHVRSALAAYPELGNHPERPLDVWTHWGVCANVLGVGDHVLDFFRTVLDEVMDLFPSPYVHIGGDEVPTQEWEASPAAIARAAREGLSGPRELHGWFLTRMADHVVQAGRRPVAWAEDGSTLPLTCTVMSWRTPRHAWAAARRGHDVIHTDHRSTYFDYARDPGPMEPLAQPGHAVDLRTVYGVDLVPPSDEPLLAGKVLGTQGQLWTEFVPTPEHIEYLTYPRLCALAERAWGSTSIDDWPDFRARLDGHRARLTALGVPHDTLRDRAAHAPV
ncbi:beta-N-acetylhexosaminidase [Streptomyces cinnabarinus]|uniref:beta-N-acetylhexosaminidase n=1 Tax=Streptomyces cinnabarinus TaxID=67287 RepID=A0ABY7KRR8_9ACTN|nr:beta-N-acetylhexosaminidase [Streptomyces cinnabarinus]WAZ26320.1 beta-N-acetylhexosaminidase [Streptomyces cinnabarinus]